MSPWVEKTGQKNFKILKVRMMQLIKLENS